MKLSYALALSSALSASAIDQLHVRQIPRRVLQQVDAGAELDGKSMSANLIAVGYSDDYDYYYEGKGAKSSKSGSKGSKSGTKGSKSAADKPPSNAELAVMIDEVEGKCNETAAVQSERIEDLEETTTIQGEEIEDQNATIRELEKNLDETTAVQSERIEDLEETTIVQGEEIEGLNETASSLGVQIGDILEEVAELKREVNELKIENFEQERKIGNQGQQIADLQERVSELEGPLGNFTLLGDGQCGDSQSRRYSYIQYGAPFTPQQCADECLELDDPPGMSLVGFEFANDADPDVDNCACLFTAGACPQLCFPLPGFNEVANLLPRPDARSGSSSDDRPMLTCTCYSYDNFVPSPSQSPTASPTPAPTRSLTPSSPSITSNPTASPTTPNPIQFELVGQGFCYGKNIFDYYANAQYNNAVTLEDCSAVCGALASTGALRGMENADGDEFARDTCNCLLEGGYITDNNPGVGNCPSNADKCDKFSDATGPIQGSNGGPGTGFCYKVAEAVSNFVYVGIGFCRDSSGKSYDYAEFSVSVGDPLNNKDLVEAECRSICDPLVDLSSYPIPGFELNYREGLCSCLFEDGFLDEVGCPSNADKCRTTLPGTGPVDYSSGSGDCFKNENYAGPSTDVPTGNPTPSPTRRPTTDAPTRLLSLSTTYGGFPAVSGNVFSVRANSALNIQRFDIHTSARGCCTTVKVYHRAGPYAGFEPPNLNGWAVVHDSAVQANGNMSPTPLNPFAGAISVDSGGVHSFYVTVAPYWVLINSSDTDGKGEGQTYKENDDMAILVGFSLKDSVKNAPRVWNGEIYYSLQSSSSSEDA